jgi:hypothetical protein
VKRESVLGTPKRQYSGDVMLPPDTQYVHRSDGVSIPYQVGRRRPSGPPLRAGIRVTSSICSGPILVSRGSWSAWGRLPDLIGYRVRPDSMQAQFAQPEREWLEGEIEALVWENSLRRTAGGWVRTAVREPRRHPAGTHDRYLSGANRACRPANGRRHGLSGSYRCETT